MKRKRIACVGDSITRMGYPEYLQDLLGSDYVVGNFGIDAATASRTYGHGISYWETPHFQKAKAFSPDIVTIQLGTNDSRDMNWPLSSTLFKQDYIDLIEVFATLPTKPQIILCSPPKAFAAPFEINDRVIYEEIIPIIKKVALSEELPVMDNYNGMMDSKPLLYDGVHPTKAGSVKLAELFRDFLLSSNFMSKSRSDSQ